TRAVDSSVLNLYDQGGTLGPADATLVGAASGTVAGSLVLNATGDRMTFIRTGGFNAGAFGLLDPDTYTVTLRSAADGFKDSLGRLLDGNGDGILGDNYTTTFTVTAPPASAVTVSLPDFARGYGQPVNVPASVSTGIPITLSNGHHVTRVDVTLR